MNLKRIGILMAAAIGSVHSPQFEAASTKEVPVYTLLPGLDEFVFQRVTHGGIVQYSGEHAG